MKTNKTALVISFIFLFLGANLINAVAQRPLKKRPRLSRSTYTGIDTIERKSVFISYPTNFFASTLKIGYEFKVAHNKGLALLGTLGGGQSSENSSTYYGVTSFNEEGLEAQLRIYILKDRPALNGLYLAPYMSYKTMAYVASVQDQYTGSWSDQPFNTSSFGIGYVMGYQYIFSSGFTFNTFLGGGDYIISGDNTHGSVAQNPFGYPKGIAVHMGIGIGIAF
jgi:hypothetical protein